MRGYLDEVGILDANRGFSGIYMNFTGIGEILRDWHNRAILGVLHILSKIHCKLNGKYGKSMSRHGLLGFQAILHISRDSKQFGIPR